MPGLTERSIAQKPIAICSVPDKDVRKKPDRGQGNIPLCPTMRISTLPTRARLYLDRPELSWLVD